MPSFFRANLGVRPTALYPRGNWNANTNDPLISDATGVEGYFYSVSVAGTQDLGSGNIDFGVGDWVWHDGAVWHKADNTDQVSSVFGRQGAVVAQASDYDASQIDNDSSVSGATVKDALETLDSNKADKVSGATDGNFAGLNASGNLTDSGSKASDFATIEDSIVNALVFG